MSDETIDLRANHMNPSIAAVVEEIRRREQELEALRAALAVLQSDRLPLVHIATGRNGEFAISNVFHAEGGGNGHSTALAPMVLTAPARSSRVDSRASTARLLKLFDRSRAQSLAAVAALADVPSRNIAVGVLLKHGYLKKKGDGYVRTAKDYTA